MIAPALTADEWALADKSHTGANWPRHATAALALYGQPFGFTREDVWRLRAIERGEFIGRSGPRWLTSLADRIEALLPEQP